MENIEREKFEREKSNFGPQSREKRPVETISSEDEIESPTSKERKRVSSSIDDTVRFQAFNDEGTYDLPLFSV